MSAAADGGVSRRVTLVMNPTSGRGRIVRFGLVEAAERAGARVLMTGPDRDAGTLARAALQDGADVLGAAGGDGTVSAVAAVAAVARRPLVVVPAGTRNHFARDLGLDIHHPLAALDALADAESARVDLGAANGRTFVNNVSLGMYAEALLNPHYRQGRARAMASVAGPYLDGRHWVDATVSAPGGTLERPQVVLISNNPYHVATPQNLGRRFALDGAVLGAIVVRRSAGPTPPPPPRLMRAQTLGPGADDGLVRWSAPRVVVEGAASTVAAGVDGEAVNLGLPLTCTTMPGALHVLLPRDRPGVPPEPAPPKPPGLSHEDAPR